MWRMLHNVECMLRAGFRTGFLPVEAGKNQAGTGARGLTVPGMQYHTLLWLRFLNFSFSQFKTGVLENSPLSQTGTLNTGY
jgi:hypothetical protein